MIKKMILPLLLMSGVTLNANKAVDLVEEVYKGAKDAIADAVVGYELDYADYKNDVKKLDELSKDTEEALKKIKNQRERNKLVKKFFEEKLDLYKKMSSALEKGSEQFSSLSGDLIVKVDELEKAAQGIGKAAENEAQVKATKEEGRSIARQLKATLKRIDLAGDDKSKKHELNKEKNQLYVKLKMLAVQLRNQSRISDVYKQQEEWATKVSDILFQYSDYAQNLELEYQLQVETLRGEIEYTEILLSSGGIGVEETIAEIQRLGGVLSDFTGGIDKTIQTGVGLQEEIFNSGLETIRTETETETETETGTITRPAITDMEELLRIFIPEEE